MIVEYRGSRQSVEGDIKIDLAVSMNEEEATAVVWYAGSRLELAMQCMLRDRMTRAVDAHREWQRRAPGWGSSPR